MDEFDDDINKKGINFQFLVEHCQTIGDVQKLQEELKNDCKKI